MDDLQKEPQKKRFIESSSFFTNCESVDPFSKMTILDSSFLENVPNRSSCPVCNRSRKYYCYTCYVPVTEVSGDLPIVNLPVKIDIIKHPKEVDGKSTAAHAAVLAPNDVKVYTYPDFPSYENEKVLLIFPGKSAMPFQDWWALKQGSHSMKSTSSCERSCFKNPGSIVSCEDNFFSDTLSLPFSKVIFIDSTWRQSKALYSDPRLNELPCVMLSSYKSLFWRYYRGKQETHLSTIEAIYYFLVELNHFLCPELSYDGKYDNLLFFF
ncbi:tRNA-uridine aminocarboxypropyltransferase 1-like isoform X2 [Uloborus diversus]|uniref:tRNA-uridine aminocarboxypropyltransferase 1-like isoform X2 n=1 Tax=Uloborus diversus TaxID=327109 RepID=UPI0024099F2A|nr:tRNA-uridine aminocarboxypropyltransferase 1-like isoform X2 [Uloborus diversus]